MHATDIICLSSTESKTTCSSNDESFTRILLQHRSEMFSLCRRCTRQEADAEEAFSRASLLLYRKLPAYRERLENLRGWILRLTFNVCMSLHRENRRRGEQSLDEVGADSLVDPRLLASRARDPESSYLQKEMGQFLRSSIDDLPERLRETVISHLSLDSYREIADHLSINEANVRKRMQEARQILSRRLARYRAGAAQAPVPRRSASPRQAAKASSAGDPPERVRALRAVEAVLPGGRETEGLLALRLPLANEPRRALERYVEEHPRGGKKRLALARALLEEGRAEDALPHLEHGVEKQPRHLGAWLDLIAVCRFLKRPAAAADACERALAAHRGPAATLFQGLREQCLGRTAEAEQAFLDARDAAPESPAPCVALAELHIAAGRPKEAADALDEALARSPTDVAALTLGSEALRLLGRSSEARRRDALALELDGANPPALERSLALSVRRAGGRLPPDDGLWNKIQRLAGIRAEARSLLGFIRICGGDLAGVGETFSYVVERPRCLQARIEHARLQDAIGRPLAALQEIDAGRILQAHSRELDLLACRLSVRAGLPGRALLESENLLARHGDTWETASTAAWVLAHLGKTKRAAELSQAAVARQPDLPAAWLEHGRVLARCERMREAIAATETGWSLIPEGDGFDLATPAALDLAVLHWRLGYPEWARQWALEALEACAGLGEVDPVRACIFRRWIQAELGTESALSRAAGSMDIAPSFPQITERWLLTMQISEMSFG